MRTRIWVRLAGWGCCLCLCQGAAGLPGWCAAGESGRAEDCRAEAQARG